MTLVDPYEVGRVHGLQASIETGLRLRLAQIAELHCEAEAEGYSFCAICEIAFPCPTRVLAESGTDG